MLQPGPTRLALAVLLSLWFAAPGFAATLFVDATAPPGGDGSPAAPFQTIQEGVDAAVSGDLVTVAAGTYTTPSSRLVGAVLRAAVVFMKDGVTVQGAGAGLTVIDGSGANTGVIFDGIAAATLDGVTVQNGYFRGLSSSFEGGGGILSQASSATISNATITGNRAVPYGAGLLVTSGGSATLVSASVVANQAQDPGGAYPRPGAGGGVAVYRAAATIAGCNIASNFAGNEGGGISAWESRLTLTTSLLDDNTSDRNGGAIYANNSSLQISTSTMGGNDARNGGAVSVYYSEATITGGGISNNSALSTGGAIYAGYSQVRIDRLPMLGNSSQGEGGVARFWNTAAALSDTTIDGNDASSGGGGIWGYYHTRLVVSGGSISGNLSGGAGGGIYLGGYSDLAIDGATISGNTATGRGGGIYSSYNREKIANATISDNVAGSSGGGMYSAYGVGELSRNIITGNSAGAFRAGGGLYLYAAKSVVGANIIAYNSAYYGGGVAVYSECASCFDKYSTFATLANNSIVGNTADGFSGGGGMYVGYNSWVAITNNTVVGNQAPSGRGGGLYLDDNEVLYLANNIVQGNSAEGGGGGVYYRSSNGTAPPLITNNDIEGNTPENWATGAYSGVPDPTGTSGNVAIDPLLSNSAAGIYTLLPGSPAIDTGTLAIPGIGGPDALAGPRLQASAVAGAALVDLGAVEFPYPGPNTPPVAIAISRAGFRKNGTVVLDGARSFDPDGEPLTFLWSQVAGPPVTLSSTSGAFVTLLNVGTPRTPAAGPFDSLLSLPTSVAIDLTVSDGKSSDTTRLEVRMLAAGTATDIDTAGYLFDQETGIPNYKGGIAFAADGSEYFVVAEAEFGVSPVFRGPVVRDPLTSRILGLGPAQRFATVPRATGLARHPSGTLFVPSTVLGATTVQNLVEIRPDGTTSAFDITALGAISPLGLAFVPPGPANAGRLLLADEATQRILEVQLTDNGDGTFTPTTSTHFLDLTEIVDLRPAAMTFLGPDGGPYDLLVFGTTAGSLLPSETAYRIALDPATGQVVGGPDSPTVSVAYNQLSGVGLFSPYGADRDPLSGQIVVSNPFATYPYASLLFFDPLPLDFDRDGAPDALDNCPSTPNPTQSDSNENGIGDPCDNLAAVNAPPVANAGGDQGVNEGDLVVLDGSSSFDPESAPLGFAWTQTGGPPVAVSDPAAAAPTFVAPAVATNGATIVLSFELVVTDGTLFSPADALTVVVANVNQAPASNAGPDQAVAEGQTVFLDGSTTSDPDLDPFALLWTQTSGPVVVLSDAAAPAPSFVAPAVLLNGPPLTLVFNLAADDGLGGIANDSATILVANLNLGPTANAGAPQSVSEGTLGVLLDGSASTDPDLDPLSYAWVQTSGPAVALSDPAAAAPTFTAPLLPTNTPVVLTFGLTIDDSFGGSAVASTGVTVTNLNGNPTANAGAPQSVLEGTVGVILDGSASTDPDLDSIAFAWVQISGPAVALSDPAAAAPTFTAPLIPTRTPVVLTFEVTVDDGIGGSALASTSVTVTKLNGSPSADAGAPQTVVEGTAGVVLDSTASTDPDLDPLSFAWSQTSGPAVALSNPAAAAPTFTAPLLPTNTPVVLTFGLTVDDGFGGSAFASTSVTVTNLNGNPIANAGAPQSVSEGTLGVVLDGSASTDPDLDPLSYAWVQTSGPAVALSDPAAAAPTFTAPLLPTNTAVVLTFGLTVDDNFGGSAIASTSVTVTNLNGNPTANAGAPQSVLEGTVGVILDGSASTDPDLDSISFAWVEISGPAVTLSNPAAPAPTFTAPLIPTRTPVVLTFELTVDDGTGGSALASTSVTVTKLNGSPSADAGAPQAVVEGTAGVVLDGTASTDPDLDPLSFAWIQTAGPAVALSDPAAAAPAFTAPLIPTNTPVVLTFGLTVDDSFGGLAVASTSVTVTNLNGNPIANAGAPQSVLEGMLGVLLDGSASSDPDLDPLSFAWVQTSGPAVTLSDPAAAAPTFTAPLLPTTTPVVLGFEVTVNDGLGGSALASTTVTVTKFNRPPSASAGADRSIAEGLLVVLDGAGSTDPDGDALTFAWGQVSGPGVVLSNPALPSPSFTAPAVLAVTPLVFSLTTTDPGGLSDSATVTVTLLNTNTAPAISVVVRPASTVTARTLVTLDASGTTDPDPGDSFTFAWSQISGPPVALSSSSSATPTFTAPLVFVPATLSFSVVASDGFELSTSPVSVTVNPLANLPPIANAGADRRATPATGSLGLDGSASADPDPGTTLAYAWAQTSGPPATLTNPASATPTVQVSGLTPPVLLQFTLTVSDGVGGVSSDTVALQVVPVPEWHQFRHDEAHSGRTSALGPTLGGSALALTLPAGIRSSVSFDFRDAMYVGADDGRLYALNLDGSIRWSFLTGGPVRTTPLVAPDGTIYFGSFDGKLFALNPDGSVRWWTAAATGGLFRFSSPTLDPGTGRILAGSSDGVLHALDAANGMPAWTFAAGGPIYSSPVAVGGRVLFGANDGRLRALDAASGALVYEVDAGAPIQSSPAVDSVGGRVFVGADDGRVLAFDLQTGAPVWSFLTAGAVTSSPALDLSRGRIYVGSDDRSLYALDAATGAVVWQRATGEAVRSSPTVDMAGNIYVGSCDGNVYAFDAAGTILFTFFSSGLIIPSPTLGADGLLYLGSDDRFLYAIGPDPFGGVPLRAARVDRVEPAGAQQGDTIEVTVLGADLGLGMDLGFGSGVKVLGSRVVSSREVRATLTLEPGAPLGWRDVVVSSPAGLPSTQVEGFEVRFDCRRADLSQDGLVDGIDLALLAGRFGEQGEPGAASDLDGSGVVDGVDLALFATRFGGSGECR